MALLTMNVESQYLGVRHFVSIILPDLPRSAVPSEYYKNSRSFKALWLLHGTYGDCTDWVRRSNIEVYACEHNLAVIMPSGLNADYVNWSGFGIGFSMYDYLFEELMPLCYNWLPISRRREDNFIAGLSMGGMGAMVYALGRPELFAAAGSLSGPIFDPRAPMPRDLGKAPQALSHLAGHRPPRRDNQIANAGGIDGYLKSPANTYDRLLSFEQDKDCLPKLYFCCGEDDFLFPAYTAFKAAFEDKGFDIVFEQEAGYTHEWRFWDKYIERFIKRYVADSEGESK